MVMVIRQPTLDLGSQNTDDGDLNYKDGEIIDATQKVFTEIDGSLQMVLV